MGLEERLKRVRIGLIRRIGRFGIRRRYISLHVDVLFFSAGCSEINLLCLDGAITASSSSLFSSILMRIEQQMCLVVVVFVTCTN